MKLSKVARRFDRLEVVDTYNPSTKFKAQLLDSSPTLRDAITNERRTLSCDSAISMPARRTISIDNTVWLCGTEALDYYRGQAIRKEVLITMADGPAQVVTAKQAIAGENGITAYASRVWIKTTSDIETNSITPNRYDIYFTETEQLAVGTFIELENTWHIVRSIHTTPSGYQVAVTEELLRELIVDLVYGKKVYEPVSDTWTTPSPSLGTVISAGEQLVIEGVESVAFPVIFEAGASLLIEEGGALQASPPGQIKGIPLRWQTHFYYMQESATKFNLGDIVLQITKTDVAQPKVGDVVTINRLAIGFATKTAEVVFRVRSFLNEGDYWSLHLSHD